jgi:hypothetical protein
VSLHSTVNGLLPRVLRPVELATARYIRTAGGRIQDGLFRGMKYGSEAHCSQLAPKLAGSYEREIIPALQRMLAARPDVFIDIGAAEGYYAVGAAFARWAPRIVAFEVEPTARAALSALMALNQLAPDRIELRGICTAEDFNRLLADCARPAVLMDIEGYELFLLDPLRVQHLDRCHLLLEHHDFVIAGLRDEICRRMEPTHELTFIEQSPRTAAELVTTDPLLRLVPAGIRRRVLSEQRPFSRHGWILMTPRPAAAPRP